MDDLMRQMLFEKLAGGSGSGSGSGDMRREMLRAFLERSAAPAEPTAEERLALAERQIAMLRDALRRSGELIAYVGRTFGACEACWGTRAECPRCHGRGAPGTYQVEAGEALGWMEPTLACLGLEIRQRAPTLNGRATSQTSQREEKTDA